MAKKKHFRSLKGSMSSKWLFWAVTAIVVFIMVLRVIYPSQVPCVVMQDAHATIWRTWGCRSLVTSWKFAAYMSGAVGVVESIIASVLVGWFLYLHPGWIARIFKPAALTIRVPISMASVPIIFGKKNRIWDNYNISLDVDFRNTGRQALEDMSHGEYDIAVASDYAICCFLKDRDLDSRNEFRVVPFALMHNQLKLLHHRNHPVSTADLKDRVIAHWPSSIHAEFLEREGLPQINATASNASMAIKDPSLLNFFTQTASGKAAACVLLEPYWAGFDKWEYQEIPIQTSMDWYMCIVFKESLLEERKGLKRRLLTALKQACASSAKNWDDALKSVADYVLQEFTGIDYDLLKTTMKKCDIIFGVPRREIFYKRINELEQLEPTATGATALSFTCLLDSNDRRDVAR